MMELNNKRREIEIALNTNDWMDQTDRLAMFSMIDVNIPEQLKVLKDVLFVERGFDDEIFNLYLNAYKNNTTIPEKIIKTQKSKELKDKLLEIIAKLPEDYEQKYIEEILEPIRRTEITLKHNIFKAIKKKTGLTKPELENIFNLCHKRQTNENQDRSEEFKEELFSEEERQIGIELGKQQNLFYRFSQMLNYLSAGEPENKLSLLNCGIGSYAFNFIQRINIKNQSSAGKSFVSRSVFMEIMPEGSTLDLSSTSPKYLYYHDFSKTPKLRILYVTEIDGVEDILYQLKGMSEYNGLNYGYVDKDKEGNSITRTLHTPPMSIITSTAKNNLTDEDENRGWIMEMDESEEQTKNIMNFDDRKDIDPDYEKKQIDKEKAMIK